MDKDILWQCLERHKSNEQDDRVNIQQINLLLISKWALIQRKVKYIIVLMSLTCLLGL